MKRKNMKFSPERRMLVSAEQAVYIVNAFVRQFANYGVDLTTGSAPFLAPSMNEEQLVALSNFLEEGISNLRATRNAK